MGNVINYLKSLPLFLEAFRKGKMVANPVAWKNGQITVAVIVGLLGTVVSILKIVGVEIPLTDEQIFHISAAIFTIVGLFLPIATVVSSEKVGLPAKDEDSGTGTTDGPTAKIPGH